MPATADVLRRLVAGVEVDPRLPFPQRTCCFGFGRSGASPLPVGALFLLWNAGPPWSQECPQCGDHALVISFGGLLNVGGARLGCIGCQVALFQPLGGLPQINQLLADSPIKGTPFVQTSMRIGGCHPSDGAQLREQIGTELPLDPRRVDDEVSLSIVSTGAPLVFDLSCTQLGQRHALHVERAVGVARGRSWLLLGH